MLVSGNPAPTKLPHNVWGQSYSLSILLGFKKFFENFNLVKLFLQDRVNIKIFIILF